MLDGVQSIDGVVVGRQKKGLSIPMKNLVEVCDHDEEINFSVKDKKFDHVLAVVGELVAEVPEYKEAMEPIHFAVTLLRKLQVDRQSQIDAKAKLAAELKLKVEADAKAEADAQSKVKADAEAKLKAERAARGVN